MVSLRETSVFAMILVVVKTALSLEMIAVCIFKALLIMPVLHRWEWPGCAFSPQHTACSKWSRQILFVIAIWHSVVIGASMAASLGSPGRKKTVAHFTGYVPGTWSGWFGLMVGHPLGAVSQQKQDSPWNLSQTLAYYMPKLILILLKEASLIKHEVKWEAS